MICSTTKHFFSHLIVRLLSMLPPATLENIMKRGVQKRVKSLKPSEGLRFLFHLDDMLYALEGTLAIAYGGGLHTKHRHTGYHEFFVRRIFSGERVLDLGCGNGVVAYHVSQACDAYVVGIDLNPENVARAEKQFSQKRLSFRVGDILEGFLGGPYDVVIMSNILEHLPRRVTFLQKVLKETGCSRFLIRVPLFERDWRVPLRRELGVEWRLDSTHEVEYTVASFQEEMKEASLVVSCLEVHWGEIWAEVRSDA